MPALSAAASKLLGMLARRDVEISALARVIERDPQLSLRVLQLSNSAAFGSRTHIVTVKHAIPFVGAASIRRHVLKWTVGNLFHRLPYDTSPMWSMTRFVMHSEATATLADLLAGRLPSEHGDAAFIAGLVHDLGKVILATVGRQEIESVFEFQRLSNLPITQCERDVLGIDHAELSSRAADMWSLPIEVQHAVATHHDLLDSDSRRISLALLLQKADRFVNSLGLSVTQPHYERPSPIEWPGHERNLASVLEAFEREYLRADAMAHDR